MPDGALGNDEDLILNWESDYDPEVKYQWGSKSQWYFSQMRKDVPDFVY